MYTTKKLGYNGAAILHAYKLNFEYYSLKNMHFARTTLCMLIQDPAPYWNEGWLARLMISMRYKFDGFQMYEILNCLL